MRAAVYARQSKDRMQGIQAQTEDCEALCRARGWDVIAVITDNDLSASNGKSRPGYDRLLEMIGRREIDMVVVSHIDRLLRKLTDLEYLIELSLQANVKVAAVTGDIDLSNDAGRLVGRILAVIARGEMERKSARQKRGNRQAAEQGKARRATPKPFGWKDDRLTPEPAEAAAVADACRALLAGGTVSGITRDWTTRGLRPHQAPGRRWSRSSIVTILRNPRIAGIATYKGTEVGRGEWAALVPEETWRAVARLLDDPGRKPTAGVRTMLGGLARCRCGNHISSSVNHLGQHVYRCNPQTRDARPGPHVAVKRADVDTFIGMLVVRRLSLPDAADLVMPQAKENANALRDEAMGIRARLARLGELFVDDRIGEADLISGRERGEKRLSEIEAELAELGRESALAPLIAAENVTKAWEGLATDRRRAVIDALMTVTLHPSGRGARTFDPDRVFPDEAVEWKRKLDGE